MSRVTGQRHGLDRKRKPVPSPLIRLWLLRALVPLGGYRKWVSSTTYETPSDEIVRALGVTQNMYEDMDELDKRAVGAQLRQLHAQAEKQATKQRLPRILAANCARIADLVGIGEEERQVLAFVVLLQQEPLLQEVTDLLGDCNVARMYRVLSVLLDLPDDVIRQALAPGGVLAQSGLITVRRDLMCDFNLRNLLEILGQAFADRMVTTVEDPMVLFRDTIIPAPKAELALADYDHVPSLQNIVLPLLQRSLTSKQQGVNVLLHGRPGTGKTQFTRVLAEQLGARLFEISSEDADGDPIDGEKRLRAFRAALCVVVSRDALLVFDEAEDVLSGGDTWYSPLSVAKKSKGWVNRALEHNPVPCVWITNSIQGIDPAFIRRFDVVQEIPVPTRPQRARLIEALCGDLVTPAMLRNLASAENLAPAVIARASTVARAVCSEPTPDASSDVIQCLVNNTLTAQGHAALPGIVTSAQREAYDPACVNVATDPEQLVQGMQRVPSARLCLYGPPGTGKTAFARWLAESIHRPLFTRRVSDLLGPYVGESEQNIAAAFQQASQEASVFLLDEVDSFLQDRRGAQHSWEVTLVNEMLTCIEACNGIFVAATNRLDSLDPAVLRRFDLKLAFDYLQPHQAWQWLQRCAASLGLPAPGLSHQQDLASLRALTPGDFATVTRQARFQPLADTSALCAALAVECALKQDGPSRPIGFI